MTHLIFPLRVVIDFTRNAVCTYEPLLMAKLRPTLTSASTLTSGLVTTLTLGHDAVRKAMHKSCPARLTHSAKAWDMVSAHVTPAGVDPAGAGRRGGIAALPVRLHPRPGRALCRLRVPRLQPRRLEQARPFLPSIAPPKR